MAQASTCRHASAGRGALVTTSCRAPLDIGAPLWHHQVIMSKTDNRLIYALIGIYVLTLFAVWLGVYLPAIAVVAKAKIHQDWLGFIGNVLAGLMTLVAAGIAFWAVQNQIRNERHMEQERRDLAAEREAHVQANARFVAVTAVAHCVHAAAAALNAARKAADPKLGIDYPVWAEAYAQGMTQLDVALSHFSIREIAPEMNINDRLLYLILVQQMATLVNIHRNAPSVMPDRAVRERDRLEALEPWIRRFDPDLGDVFVRDSKA
jgi:hypothetical protein